MKKKYFIAINIAILIITLSLGFISCSNGPKRTLRDDFKKYYDHFGVEGSFIFYDSKNDSYILYNKPQQSKQFTPASTFKIINL